MCLVSSWLSCCRLLAFSAFLVIRSAEHEQQLLAATVQDRTRAAARDIEREIGNLRSQLFVVANAGALEPDNFAALYARATAALGQRGLALVLSQPDGKEVLDTRLPLGAALPDNPDLAGVRQVVEQRRALCVRPDGQPGDPRDRSS